MNHYYSHGKLLLAGEYAVLDGVLALALPTVFGQSLTILDHEVPGQLIWESYQSDGVLWFSGQMDADQLRFKICSDATIGQRLERLFKSARSLNPSFLTKGEGHKASSQLEFPNNWGLGSSSTLINNIAQWAEVNPYTLSNLSFGGSGYDIAAAQNTQVFTYQNIDNTPIVRPITLPWTFTQNIYFVYLNKKQDSRLAIERYRRHEMKQEWRNRIDACVASIIKVKSLEHMIPLIQEHEQLISQALGLKTIQERLFQDYTGVIKSLGGWGGDFIMAIGPDHTPEYFNKLGYQTVISFDEMTQKK